VQSRLMASGSAALFCMPSFHVSECAFTWSPSGWDLHDTVYSKELLISNSANGYRDLLATIDLFTFRRIPWEDNVPFFLVSFLDPEKKAPISVCPRGVLKRVTEGATQRGWECFAGIEFEVRSPEVWTLRD
jgi:glutamine synthetase